VQNFKENKIDQLSFTQKLISKKLQLKNEQNNFFLNLCPGVYVKVHHLQTSKYGQDTIDSTNW